MTDWLVQGLNAQRNSNEGNLEAPGYWKHLVFSLLLSSQFNKGNLTQPSCHLLSCILGNRCVWVKRTQPAWEHCVLLAIAKGIEQGKKKKAALHIHYSALLLKTVLSVNSSVAHFTWESTKTDALLKTWLNKKVSQESNSLYCIT